MHFVIYGHSPFLNLHYLCMWTHQRNIRGSKVTSIIFLDFLILGDVMYNVIIITFFGCVFFVHGTSHGRETLQRKYPK